MTAYNMNDISAYMLALQKASSCLPIAIKPEVDITIRVQKDIVGRISNSEGNIKFYTQDEFQNYEPPVTPKEDK